MIATTVTKKSTGIGYGSGGADLRAERLFRHPNVPTRRWKRDKKTGTWSNEQPFIVDQTQGLVGAMGAAFFGMHHPTSDHPLASAPAVAQVRTREMRDIAPHVRLWTFGFHMLSDKRNVHGGVEADTFRLPNFEEDGLSDNERRDRRRRAQLWSDQASDAARLVARDLQRAIQTAEGVDVRTTVDDDRNVRVEKTEHRSGSGYDYGRDALAAYWRGVQYAFAEHAQTIAHNAAHGKADAETTQVVRDGWNERVRSLAWKAFEPAFERAHVQASTMVVAFAARAMFGGALRKSAPLASDSAPAQPPASTAQADASTQPDLFSLPKSPDAR